MFDATLCLVQVAEIGVGAIGLLFIKDDKKDVVEGIAMVRESAAEIRASSWNFAPIELMAPSRGLRGSEERQRTARKTAYVLLFQRRRNLLPSHGL